MVEFIGFIISIIALLYIVIRQSFSPQSSESSHIGEQGEELSEDDPLREFMRAVEKETAAREAAQRLPPPPVIAKQPRLSKQSKKALPTALEDYRLKSEIEKRHVKSALEERRMRSRFNHFEELPAHTVPIAMPSHLLEEEKVHRPSRARKTMQRLSSSRDLLIYYEIMHPPKSMR